MKNLLLFLSVALAIFACDDENSSNSGSVEIQTVQNLQALGTAGNYTLYSLRTNSIVTDSNSTSWDIGFRRTSIIVNGGTSGPGQGGVLMIDGILDEITEAPETGYTTTLTGSWYNYTGEAPTGPKHAILPVPGKLLALKTADGKYAVVQIVSYYKDNPDVTLASFVDLATRPAAHPDRHFSFRFALQTGGGRTF